ncbi:2-amino-4-hydroxy-6-hydroxymethyldihydropteridine diphosphokinase [Rhizobium skierniewicense]|uniref:2-amino-4-hydroxy-6-hydroxymethyldihydropteridine pyrophosphokinase n=1 Tax=Rhizobium skierniewicense TaxID=984260 RepID=A0A7W6G344_9HYPH|nr:2-amino-4-hydroxy-6-hydroxymethyldihydropteridine diphosphokinase [Rhizobium skierniewicense]MBB3947853.1 2-amino-4-hydroxy-6-hydroxymethyldihydropteridine diphosphokinase [Rhizobium skierniewicense]
MADSTVKATLGLGGNLGDPPSAMAHALDALSRHESCQLLAVSKLYSTPPWGKTDQADFFNCCALIETSLRPEPLLDLCLEIERGMKRVRDERWGPRTIDIDVLTYGDVQVSTARVEIPHPRMTERAFVLKPLCDIAPDLVVNGRKVNQWLEDADMSGIKIATEKREWWALPSSSV